MPRDRGSSCRAQRSEPRKLRGEREDASRRRRTQDDTLTHERTRQRGAYSLGIFSHGGSGGVLRL
eukprot:7507175-Pyramimonas_sp.AAC.1